ncbi:TPA: glutathionylspermidine synthase family protein [Pseudomonas aeruginosa]|nr:glutathionylspermidine synthase family protein [Pseudomonas aeruginosa]
MKRIQIAERLGWQAQAEHLGFKFHTIGGERYWDERNYYQFTLQQVEQHLEDPTKEIHEMCMDLVERVVENEHLLNLLAIPSQFHDLVRTSWKEGHPHLYGRMDLTYNGSGPAKLLELNYDTPTSLYEAGAFQWLWLEDSMKRGVLPAHADQFNSIQDRLLQAMATLRSDLPFYFASVKESEEDKGTTDYLRDIAEQAGLKTEHIDIEDIGLNGAGRFTDLQERWIPRLFKLYPWEHMFLEEFGAAVPSCDTQFIEPAWKAILSNKAALALLWEYNKGHPNLLPTYFDKEPQRSVPAGWVRKPFFSREGANIELRTPEGLHEKEDGPYTDAPYIMQEFSPLPRFGDSYTLIGSWVIGDQPAGIGIREDDSLITKDSSRFVPHIILD